MVYHQPNRLVAPPRKEGFGNNNAYLWGNTLSEKRYVSGLGCYYSAEQGDKRAIELLKEVESWCW